MPKSLLHCSTNTELNATAKPSTPGITWDVHGQISRVLSVEPGKQAARLGVSPGDELVSVSAGTNWEVIESSISREDFIATMQKLSSIRPCTAMFKTGSALPNALVHHPSSMAYVISVQPHTTLHAENDNEVKTPAWRYLLVALIFMFPIILVALRAQ